ncbi:MAG: hypothetical protein V4723_09265 [Pseudomonadota bacterium]
MSANFYSRGAEDRKPVSLHELHKARYGIVTLGSAQRERAGATNTMARRVNVMQQGGR